MYRAVDELIVMNFTLVFRKFLPISVLVILFGCNSDSNIIVPEVSTIQTNVDFSGTPNLQTESGVFVLDSVLATLYSIRFPECTELGLHTSSLFPLAHAGHSDIEIPSNWARPTFVDLLNPTSIETSVELQTPQPLCDGVVTWARWDGGTFDLPTPQPISTFSIQAIGSCQPHDEGEPVDFVLETTVPAERVRSLQDSFVEQSGTQLHFHLDIDPTDMLQNIPCTPELNDQSSVYALQILLNLQQGTTWIWEWT